MLLIPPLVGGCGHAPSLVVSLSSVKVVRHKAEIPAVEKGRGGRDRSTALYRGIAGKTTGSGAV